MEIRLKVCVIVKAMAGLFHRSWEIPVATSLIVSIHFHLTAGNFDTEKVA